MPFMRWTEDETKLAIRLYFELPFGKLHSKQKDIISLALTINRSASSIAMKLVNFASMDPSVTSRGRTGLGNVSKLDRKVWQDFHANWTLALEDCERISDEYNLNTDIATIPRGENFDDKFYSISEVEKVTKRRIGQDFFRKSVISNFDTKCCVTGISESAVLTASHIVPWSVDEKNRHNPMNGLALSATFDRAFDVGLITLDQELKLEISDRLLRHSDSITRNFFKNYSKKPISRPVKFDINLNFISKHQEWSFSVNRYE